MVSTETRSKRRASAGRPFIRPGTPVGAVIRASRDTDAHARLSMTDDYCQPLPARGNRGQTMILTATPAVTIIGIHRHSPEELMSRSAKLFMSGRSQAVRLPKELRFEGDSVIAKRFGKGVLLLPTDAPWSLMAEALEEFEPGFRLERDEPAQQERPEWL